MYLFVYFSSFCHTHFTSCVSYFSEMIMISSCLFSIFCYFLFLLHLKTNSTSTLLFPWFWMQKKINHLRWKIFSIVSINSFSYEKHDHTNTKYEIRNIKSHSSNSKIRGINKIFKFNKNCFKTKVKVWTTRRQILK